MQEKEQKISPIKQRILDFAASLGCSKREFYNKIGVSRGTLESRTGITEDVMAKFIAAFPDVNIGWLMTGTGQMIISDSVNGSLKTDDAIGIPLIPVEAMAGFLSGEVLVNESECDRLNIPGLKADFVIPVSGDSMEPKYYSGDYVACQSVSLSDMFFQWGKVYVIDTNQGVLLKKVRKSKHPDCIALISENPEYDPITMPLEDIYHIALVKGLVRIV